MNKRRGLRVRVTRFLLVLTCVSLVIYISSGVLSNAARQSVASRAGWLATDTGEDSSRLEPEPEVWDHETLFNKGGSVRPPATKKTPALFNEAPKNLASGALVTIARNENMYTLASTMKSVEDRFNHRFHYDWVFFNNVPFDDGFKQMTSDLASGRTFYYVANQTEWGYPGHIDQTRAAVARNELAEIQVPQADNEQFRFISRFTSGFLGTHPGLAEYKWMMRVDSDVHMYCDVDYDVFRYMETHKKRYGFVFAPYEVPETMPGFWETIRWYTKDHHDHIHPHSAHGYLSKDNGQTYSRCHFLTNFEVVDLDFLRSVEYLQYFKYLDFIGGFFYERWGDSIVRAAAVSLLMDKSEIQFFADMGARHNGVDVCPQSYTTRLHKKCACDPSVSPTWNENLSCVARLAYIQQHDVLTGGSGAP